MPILLTCGYYEKKIYLAFLKLGPWFRCCLVVFLFRSHKITVFVIFDEVIMRNISVILF